MNNISTNGWSSWDNRRFSSMEKYANQIVVVVSRGSKRHLYLSNKVMELLNNPGFIQIFVRGNNVGLAFSEAGIGYKVDTENVLASIFPSSLLKHFNLASGAYTAHFENDMIIFDIEQTPAKV